MFGIIYIILGWYNGYFFLKKLIPSIFNYSKTKDLLRRPVSLPVWMVTIPASFLAGMLLITWTTYIAAYLFRSTQNPILYGNICSLSISFIIAAFITVKNRTKYIASLKNTGSGSESKNGVLNGLKGFIVKYSTELFYTLSFLLVWTYFMIRSFYIKKGTIYIGHSVFSDFAPHLSVIRSFSMGSNFPTQYPHFADGSIRYHFMFQFLCGNLEFLGLRLDWAFNLPSIISIVSFLMLLYAFIVLLLGDKRIAIFTGILFFFRSSFAFFTHISKMKTTEEFFNNLKTLSVHIGKTENEGWGLWAQKVYVNQRHLPFALGLMMLLLIIVLPLFKNMVRNLCNLKNKRNNGEISKDEYKSMWFKEFLLSPDAWLPKNLIQPVAAGLIIGLTGFWNGAVVITLLPILFVLALLSKRRLEYLIIASICGILVYAQSLFFIGTGSSPVKTELYFGFLADTAGLSKNLSLFYQSNGFGSTLNHVLKLLPYVFNFYIELLGLLPFVVLAVVLPKRGKLRIASNVLFYSAVVLAAFFFLKHQLKYDAITNKETFTVSIIIAFAVFIIPSIYYTFFEKSHFPDGLRWVALAFSTPFIVATTLKLTPDINVNHKYIVIGSILLDILVAYFLFNLFKSRFAVSIITSCLLFLALTITGFVDIKTLFNLDKNYVTVNANNQILTWVSKNTRTDELFLTDNYSLHPILLAGRKVFSGWTYYTWSAGYDTDTRELIKKRIYSCNDASTLKSLVESNNIDYIVVDDGNRTSQDYVINEAIIKETYPAVFSSDEGNLVIYKTN